MGGRTRERLIHYGPLVSQRSFHRSHARFKGFSGPVGSGKSAALVQEAIRQSYINAGRTGLIGAPTFPMLRDATQTAFLEALELNQIPYELNKSEQVLIMKETRSRILFRSLEEFERLRGTNLAWFGVDELTYSPEGAWLRLEGRLRDPLASQLCGFGVWTPKGFDWVYRRFVGERVEGYELIQAKPMENQYLLKAAPDFYERLKYSYDQRFYEQEALGQYLNVQSGQTYHAFSRTDHVRILWADPALPLYWSLDFNVDPMTSVVAQIKGEEVRVVGEIVLSRATTWEACEAFHQRYGRHPGGVILCGDASGNKAETSGWSDFSIVRGYLRDKGVTRVREKIGRSNPPVRVRVNLVNSKLRSAEGEIHLLVDPRCPELIKDFEEVVFLEGRQELDKNRDWKRTHASDALGYLLCAAFEDRPGLQRPQRRIV